MKERMAICIARAMLVPLLIINSGNVQTVEACYGPHITANISRTQVNIHEMVTITGIICPVEENKTIRVTFTRPDYTWIDRWVLTDNVTGGFSVTQELDMAGYWNIFPINGHMDDRLFAEVSDPNAQSIPQPALPPIRPNYSVIALSGISISIAVVAITWGARKKTRKVSSLRLFV